MGKVHQVATVAELPVGTQKIIQIGRRSIGLFNVNGSLHALPNLCPHQLGPLCEGNVSGTTYSGVETGWKVDWIQEGEIVACPWHGIEYEIVTGRCLPFPEISIRTYKVWAEEDAIYIEL